MSLIKDYKSIMYIIRKHIKIRKKHAFTSDLLIHKFVADSLIYYRLTSMDDKYMKRIKIHKMSNHTVFEFQSRRKNIFL